MKIEFIKEQSELLKGLKEKSGKISTIKNTLDYAVQNCSIPY